HVNIEIKSASPRSSSLLENREEQMKAEYREVISLHRKGYLLCHWLLSLPGNRGSGELQEKCKRKGIQAYHAV
ncbi:MAG TPA: hypothetical protein PL178_10140, partial [Prevotella sp.]|nr:hypothetical protein [Prevotella sp.]